MLCSLGNVQELLLKMILIKLLGAGASIHLNFAPQNKSCKNVKPVFCFVNMVSTLAGTENAFSNLSCNCCGKATERRADHGLCQNEAAMPGRNTQQTALGGHFGTLGFASPLNFCTPLEMQ